ncbi:MAG: hypothetical protein HY457_03555 [Parcubacteria group bacterium]|nr:hypothetical protein [Parcubacteria group bacterium]
MSLGRWMLVGGLVFAIIAFGLGFIILGIGGNLQLPDFLRLGSVALGASFLGAITGAWAATTLERERQEKKNKIPQEPTHQEITPPVDIRV